MSLETALTVAFVACFQACSIPAIVRMVRRKSSDDLSVWREVLVVVGLVLQIVVIWRVHAAWQLWVSPFLSLAQGLTLIGVIQYYRRRP